MGWAQKVDDFICLRSFGKHWEKCSQECFLGGEGWWRCSMENFIMELLSLARLRFAKRAVELGGQTYLQILCLLGNFLSSEILRSWEGLTSLWSFQNIHLAGITYCFPVASRSFALLCLPVCVFYYHIKELRSSGLFFYFNSIDELTNSRFYTLSLVTFSSEEISSAS